MPAGSRVRANNIFGLTSDNPLSAVSVSFNSAGLANLPAVILGTQHAIITLDPLRVNGEPEIIVVTAHTVSTTLATITRAAYGTVTRAHPQGTMWMHTPIDEDYIEVLTAATRPSNPYRGESIFETDTNRFVARSTADVWQQNGLFFDPPSCRVYHNVAQSIPHNTLTTLAFNSERYDTDTMHDTVTNNSRITFTTAGLYVVGATVVWASAAGVSTRKLAIELNGVTEIFADHDDGVGGVQTSAAGGVYKFAAGNYIECWVYQFQGGAVSTQSIGNSTPEFWATWIGRGN